jgi:hypothetical protein
MKIAQAAPAEKSSRAGRLGQVLLRKEPVPFLGEGAGSFPVLFFHAVKIAAVAGVYLNEVTLVDEQRHAYFHTCLQCGGW